MKFIKCPFILSLIALASAVPHGNYTRDTTEMANAANNVASNIPSVYQMINFFVPSLVSVRSPISVTSDLMDIYWALRKNDTLPDSVYTQYNIRLQELQFERLLGLDSDSGRHSIESVEIYLRLAYDILYSQAGIVAEVSDERRQQLDDAIRNMMELRTPVIDALYSSPFRSNIPAQLELELYVRSAPRLLMIGRYTRDPQERRVLDIIRGLRSIVSAVNQRTTTTRVAQPTLAMENMAALSSTVASLVL